MKNKVPLLDKPLPSGQSLAFISSPQLGDSLIGMVTVHNLRRNGYRVTVFGNFLHALKAWFPQNEIQPVPTERLQRDVFSQFDGLIYTYAHNVQAEAEKWHPHVIVLAKSSLYLSHVPMADVQVKVCEYDLHLKNLVRTNEMAPLPGLNHRCHTKRVIIHPTSNVFDKNWLPKRFLQLGQLLKKEGYRPTFIVSPAERKDWLWLIEEGLELPEFESLDAVAQWVYESDLFIGNDSGIGHLASNMDIPTVTLGMRPGKMAQWRPSWAPGLIVLPPPWLISRQLKERYWKYFISTQKVKNAFDKLANMSSRKLN